MIAMTNRTRNTSLTFIAVMDDRHLLSWQKRQTADKRADHQRANFDLKMHGQLLDQRLEVSRQVLFGHVGLDEFVQTNRSSSH